MARPKKSVKKTVKKTTEMKKVGEEPKAVEAGEPMTKEEFDEKAAPKKVMKRKKLILDRTKMEEVEKYVKEGKKVHVMGVGAERKYIIFLEGD